MTDSRRELGEVWHLLNREIHQRMRQAFRGCELPFMAMLLLRQIDQEPGVTVNELARRIGVVKSHVSGTLEQLMRQDYVQKRPDPSDQRLLRIYATDAARRTLSDMESRARGVWSEVTTEIPDGEIEEVLRGLRLLLEALERSGTTAAEAGAP